MNNDMSPSHCPQCDADPSLPEQQPTITLTPLKSARYQKLLKSNDAPDSATLRVIRDLMSGNSRRAVWLNTAISNLRSRLDDLEEEMTLLSEQSVEMVGILFRRMPPSVLSQIFLSALPTLDHRKGNTSDMKQTPWVLSQVCMSWRKICLATPQLWSTICVDYKEPSNSLYEMVKTQVDRAHKLKIHFYGSEDSDSAPQVELFDFLAKHSTRWEALDMHLTAALAPRLNALRGHLRSLKRVWTHCNKASPNGIPVINNTRTITCFETASSLVDAGAEGSDTFVHIRFPANQLTSYRVQCPWKMHMKVLSAAANLVEARIVVDFDKGNPWPTPKIITLPRLQRLYAANVQMLGYLTTPSLTELALCVQDDDKGGGDKNHLLGPLKALFCRSSYVPRRLCLRGCPLSATTEKILTDYPAITSFALLVSPYDDSEKLLFDTMDEHLSMFTVTPQNPGLFPHLEEIYFGVTGIKIAVRDSYRLFVEMLQSRWTQPERVLRSAAFITSFADDPAPDTRQRLKTLENSGLSLVVGSSDEAQRCMGRWSYDSTVWTG